MEPERRVQVTVRLPEPLYETLRQRSFDTKTSQQDILEKALEAYLQETKRLQLTKQEERLVEIAVDLLRHGPDDVCRILEATLAVAVRRKKSR